MSVSFTGKSARVKIAVCGELNSGKTSLLNALYRDGTLPDFFGIPTKPIIKISFAAEKDLISFTTFDDKVKSVKSPEQIPVDGSVRDVEIFTRNNTFGACDVIEFTRLRDGYITDDDIANINGCDVMIWMTIGSQAWRLSEKTIVGKFSNQEPALSILAVSRADKFRNDTDKTRLEARVVKETKGYFDHHLMMRLEPETLDAANKDDGAWEDIGGKELVACLSDLVAKIEPTGSDIPHPESQPTLTVEEADEPAEATSKTAFDRKFKSSRRKQRISKMLATRFGPGTETPSSTEDTSALPKQETEENTAAKPMEPLVLPTESEILAENGDQTNKIKVAAESLDGLLALVTFSSDSPDDVTLVAGDLEYGKTLAQTVNPCAKLLVETEFYEQPQWGHLSTENHQILYRLENDGNDVLVLACQSGNAGLARNAFLRIMKFQDENALELV